MKANSRSAAPNKGRQATLAQLKRKLLTANKILDMERLATPFGHISVRIPETETFLITRSVSPGSATLEDFVICNMDGKIVEGKYSDTYSEVVIHTGVYKTRPDVNSVIHSHSTYVIGLSLAGGTVIPANLQITVVGLEPIAVYKKMLFIDRPEQGLEVAKMIGENRAVILKGHGAVTIGVSIEDAMYSTLTLERSAMYQWLARSVGPVAPISKKEKQLLRQYHDRLRKEGHGAYREWAYYEQRVKNMTAS